MAVVEGLWIFPQSGSDPVRQTDVAFVAGQGIEGDRYFLGNGTYSVLPEKGRQCTLISADSAKKALADAGMQVANIGTLRRNVAVRGLTGKELLDAVGKEVYIGDCTVFVHRCPSWQSKVLVAICF